MFHPQVPTILSIAFLIAFLFPVFMIAGLAKKGRKKNVYFGVLIFFLCYLTAVSFACLQGVFNVVSLPPKIVLVTTLPLLVFLVGFVFHTPVYKKILTQVSLSDLVSVQIFRLIGSFFIILMLLELLPKPFALIAGLGDITTAVGSLFVATAITNRKKYAKKLTLIWNSFGLIDILTTSATAIFLTKMNIENGSQGVDILTQFPFCFIPAFAPPTIIFLHLSIYRKVFIKKFH